MFFYTGVWGREPGGGKGGRFGEIWVGKALPEGQLLKEIYDLGFKWRHCEFIQVSQFLITKAGKMSKALKGKLISLLEEQFFTTADMQKFEAVLAAKIKGEGWFLQKNFTVTGLSDGRSGRVDYLVTTPAGERCAIEADYKKPRKRSILKLSELPVGFTGFVLLKDGKEPLRYQVNGIDVIRATRFK